MQKIPAIDRILNSQFRRDVSNKLHFGIKNSFFYFQYLEFVQDLIISIQELEALIFNYE